MNSLLTSCLLQGRVCRIFKTLGGRRLLSGKVEADTLADLTFDAAASKDSFGNDNPISSFSGSSGSEATFGVVPDGVIDTAPHVVEGIVEPMEAAVEQLSSVSPLNLMADPCILFAVIAVKYACAKYDPDRKTLGKMDSIARFHAASDLSQKLNLHIFSTMYKGSVPKVNSITNMVLIVLKAFAAQRIIAFLCTLMLVLYINFRSKKKYEGVKLLWIDDISKTDHTYGVAAVLMCVLITTILRTNASISAKAVGVAMSSLFVYYASKYQPTCNILMYVVYAAASRYIPKHKMNPIHNYTYDFKIIDEMYRKVMSNASRRGKYDRQANRLQHVAAYKVTSSSLPPPKSKKLYEHHFQGRRVD